MIAYKFLEAGRIGPYSGYQWPKPGVWLPPIEGDLVMCQRGYHLCRPADLIHWIDAELWRVEYRGEVMEGDNKIAVRECRIVEQAEPWNERTARLFAADCAEDVLPLFEREYPGDNRPRAAIETARAFANGECAEADLVAAAAAAWDAAWDAARQKQNIRLLALLEIES